MQHEQANASRARVSGPSNGARSVHSISEQNPRSDKGVHGGSQKNPQSSDLPRLEVVRGKAVEREASELNQCKQDYNRLYDGYKELVRAHGELLKEISMLTGERVRYPLGVSNCVAYDVMAETQL